jgi:hypothetical protein
VDLISKRAIKPPYFSIIERDLVYVWRNFGAV